MIISFGKKVIYQSVDVSVNSGKYKVIHGQPDNPVYGKGIRIKPRLPGRTDSEHMRKSLLPEFLPLEEYDQAVILLSGGKDSIACYYKLLELGVPKEKMEFWHHDIDGGLYRDGGDVSVLPQRKMERKRAEITKYCQPGRKKMK